MTLQQAFTEWAAIPQNTVLAARSRSAVNAVLMKTYGSCDVRQFTAYYTRLLFKKCNEPPNFKTKAASILVYVLEYAASREKCMRPEFDFTIASADKDPSVSGEVGQEHPSPGYLRAPKPVTQSREDGATIGKRVMQVDPMTGKVVAVHDSMEAAGRTMGCTGQNIKHAIAKGHKAMGFFWLPDGATEEQISALLSSKKDKKRRIKEFNETKRIAVSQLDPDTLEVVATFESMAAASEALGIRSKANIHFAVANRSMARGYYWCAAGMEKDFKPGAKRIARKPAGVKFVGSQERVNAPHGRTSDPVTRPPLSLFSDEELKEELRRRGWRGSVYMRMDL